MINIETVVKVCDNLGVKYGKCIRNLGGLKKKKGSLGDLIILSIKKQHLIDTEKITKKICLGLIVNIKKNKRRLNGTYISFSENNVVLLNENKELLGTRFDCYIPQEFRKTVYTKLIMFSKTII